MTDPCAKLEPIDLLLRQGSEAELHGFRDRVAEDPLLALELADTVALIERLRTVRVDPSPEFTSNLMDLGRRLQPRPKISPMSSWLFAAAVALCSFLLATWSDPLGLSEPAETLEVDVLPQHDMAPQTPAAVTVPTAEELAHRDALAAMQQRFEHERATHLSAALEAAVQAEQDLQRDLRSWLKPQNALAVLHLDHELRARADVRQRALRSAGAMLAADKRAQDLADTIATELLASDLGQMAPHELSLSLRALVAAGASTAKRRNALGAGTALLARRLPTLVGEARAQALSALIETAAVEGLPIRGIATAGTELIDEVMLADEETWRRRRPDMLTGRVAAATLGEAGRTLALLPAFGVASDRCAFVRRLLLGQLLERRELDQEDGPEVLAAMLYGFAELLSQSERDGLVQQLRRWKLARLAPDFLTVQQIAWGVEPGRSGFTRLQRELRQLVILQSPVSLDHRASLCMCLATNYAAQHSESLERFVIGD